MFGVVGYIIVVGGAKHIEVKNSRYCQSGGSIGSSDSSLHADGGLRRARRVALPLAAIVADCGRRSFGMCRVSVADQKMDENKPSTMGVLDGVGRTGRSLSDVFWSTHCRSRQHPHYGQDHVIM